MSLPGWMILNLPVHSGILSETGKGRSVFVKAIIFIPEFPGHKLQQHLLTATAMGNFNDWITWLQRWICPGPGDIQNGMAQLSMTVKWFWRMPPKNALQLLFSLQHYLQLTYLQILLQTFNSPLILDASTLDAGSWLWLPGNETTPSITVDTLGSDRGSKNSYPSGNQTITVVWNRRWSECISRFLRKCQLLMCILIHVRTILPLNPKTALRFLTGFHCIILSDNWFGKKVGNIDIVNHQDFMLPSLPAANLFHSRRE